MDKLKLPEFFRKNTMIFIISILMAASIMAAGTFAWLSLVQRVTNDFEYNPNGIRLIKIDSITKEPLAGAVFELYEQQDGANDVFLDEFTTYDDGKIIVDSLEIGKKYHFKEIKAPDGYLIIEPNKKYEFSPGDEDIVVENKQAASLTIKKDISTKDLAGNNFVGAEYDEAIKTPFEFIVEIDKNNAADKNKEYSYVIYGADGNPTGGCEIDVTDPAKGRQEDTGKIKSGESIWLRDREKAVIQGVDVADYYIVTENDEGTISFKETPEQIREMHLNCDSDDPTDRHAAHIGTYVGDWASFGSNASGQIGIGGEEAHFTNIHIPDVLKEVTISSLVVIDRIVDEPREPSLPDYNRYEAKPHQIDHSQGFRVRITIGGKTPEEKKQKYYYEVVYIDESDRPTVENTDHEHWADYYNENDPHSDWHQEQRRRSNPGLNIRPVYDNLLEGNLFSILPSNPQVWQDLNDPYAPLHKPSDSERWDRYNEAYHPGTLDISKDNVIEVELHHQAAVIIYGIPTLTEYTAEQIYHINNGYTHHSNYLTTGVIIPDLYRIDDPHVDEKSTFGAARRAQNGIAAYSNGPAPLLRTRADIFNHYVNEKTIDIEKIWDDNNDANRKRPTSVNVTVTGVRENTERVVVTKKVKLKTGAWTSTIAVPKYDTDGTEIVYDVTEDTGSNYRASIDKVDTSDGHKFTITNTYVPDDAVTPDDSIDPDDPDPPPGGTGIPTGNASLTVTKTVNGGTDKYKQFDFTVTIGRYKYKIKLAHGQRYTFTDIPVGTRYSVSEASYAADGYSTTSTGSNGTISPSGNTAAFVNTKGEAPQSTVGSLTISKNVAGWFVDATKKFRFIVQIGDKRHEVFLKHGESTTFEGIPVGTSYTVTEDDYAHQEYITSSTGATGTISGKGETAAFVNEYVGKMWPKPGEDAVQISGKKTWIHGENANPPESITVFVMEASTIVAKKTVTAKEGWRYAFNLPKYNKDGKEIIYSINEDTVKDYFKTIKGYDLENAYNPTQNPGTGDMKVIWIWFIAMLAASIGLRTAVFYRKKRKQS